MILAPIATSPSLVTFFSRLLLLPLTQAIATLRPTPKNEPTLIEMLYDVDLLSIENANKEQSIDEWLLSSYQSIFSYFKGQSKAPEITYSEVEQAIRLGSLFRLSQLIAHNFDVNAPMSNNQYPLVFAATSAFRHFGIFCELHDFLVLKSLEPTGKKLETLFDLNDFVSIPELPDYYYDKQKVLWKIDKTPGLTLEDKFTNYVNSAMFESHFGYSNIRIIIRDMATEETFIGTRVLSKENKDNLPAKVPQDNKKLIKVIDEKITDLQSYINFVALFAFASQKKLFEQAATNPQPLLEHLEVLTFDIKKFKTTYYRLFNAKKLADVHVPFLRHSQEKTTPLVNAFEKSKKQPQAKVKKSIVIERHESGGWRASIKAP